MQMKHSFFRTTANGMHFRRPGGNFKVRWALMSVRLWNFKDGGSLKASFLAKNKKNPKSNDSLSNSAKIVLTKSILYVKN